MQEENTQGSPSAALVSLPSDNEWQPILHASNQVVLYNPTSHALTIQRHVPPPSIAEVVRRRGDQNERCPYCHRLIAQDESLDTSEFDEEIERDSDSGRSSAHPSSSRAANYFQLLQVANESSAPPTPRSSSPVEALIELVKDDEDSSAEDIIHVDTMAEGYFRAFFREECRLGMGANGSVYLCEHVLNGNPLGRFAIKKIAVGQSHSYLMNILREVRLLEQLHHPNIITYHHAWLESFQFSSFGPKVPTLHVLMQWAEGGSLDDFIDARLGRPSKPPVPPSATGSPQPQTTLDPQASPTSLSRSARIRAFRALQHAPPEERARLRRELAMSVSAGQHDREGHSTGSWLAVHLLSAEEVKALFSDVVEGLAFLHSKSILHLDLKPGNVLLTWESGKLIPKAMLSDFGTSQDMLNLRTRSGNTGTLEYTSPESLPSPTTGLLSQLGSKSDMWSLGMILYKLLFFRLPYKNSSDNVERESQKDGREIVNALEREVSTYPGFKSSPNDVSQFEARRLPRAFLLLLEGLLNVTPAARPTSERVVTAIREGKLSPLREAANRSSTKTLIPIRRTPPIERTPPPQIGTVDESTTVSVGQPVPDKLLDTFRPGLPELPPPDDTSSTQAGPFSPGTMVRRHWPSPVIVTRTIKSSLLVLKVLTISALPSSSNALLAFKSFALVIAVVDTWSDDIRTTTILVIVHIGLLFAMSALA